MKKIITVFFASVVLFAGVVYTVLPEVVIAQSTTIPCATDDTIIPCANPDGTINNGNGAGGSSNGTSFAIKINNPLKNVTTLNGLIVKLLNIILTIGVPFVALMIIYSGFLFVKAQGNDKELGTAKETLKWTLIGGTILLSAWVIAKALAGTVNQIVNGS